MKSTRKAFTLIELLIVIAIIAILAAIILISLNSARNRAKDTQVKADMSSLSKALEIYKVDQDLAAITTWKALNETASDFSNVTKWVDISGKRLITKLPTHPISGQSYYIRIYSGQTVLLLGKTTNGNDYWCVKDANGNKVTGANLSAAENACEAL